MTAQVVVQTRLTSEKLKDERPQTDNHTWFRNDYTSRRRAKTRPPSFHSPRLAIDGAESCSMPMTRCAVVCGKHLRITTKVLGLFVDDYMMIILGSLSLRSQGRLQHFATIISQNISVHLWPSNIPNLPWYVTNKVVHMTQDA